MKPIRLESFGSHVVVMPPPSSNSDFHWLDVEYIGELLAEKHPEIDPMRIGFVELKRLVVALKGFQEQPGHPCNEKILEAVQRYWIEERQDLQDEDSDESDS